MREPHFQAADCAAFDAMSSGRPRQPPPFTFAPRRLTAGQLEAKRDNARAGSSITVLRDDDQTDQRNGLTVVEPR